MCGISGFSWQDQSLVNQMNRAIKHRGPDDEGSYADPLVSLGHVRLSILDLSEKGHQPMASSDKTIWIVYNGEIYNFSEIKKELESKGYHFESHSDTEVIIAAYQEYGTNAFEKFNGIFAFCLYDLQQKCLYLVRDRLGIKPLYYLCDGTKFIFSSEEKAFRVVPGLSFSIDQSATQEYLLTHNVDSETFLNELSIVRPGHFVRFDLVNKSTKITSYHDIVTDISEEKYCINNQKTEQQLVDELEKLLHEVVKDQLISDAPLGTICSGGIDSSLVTAIACQYKKDLKIFNVKVDDENCDESLFAQRVAKHLNLELYQAVLDKKKYLELYRQCISFEDLPLMHPNSVGIYLISAKARQEGLSVLLSGEGADELFGGYHRYKSYWKALFVRRIPFISNLTKKIMRKSSSDDFAQYLIEDVRRLPGENGEFSNAYRFLQSDFERKIKSFIAADLRCYLISILRRTDRMSMGVGLEMRVPYLDNRLVDFALNLPSKHMISYSKTKCLLKKVAERYLPREIVYRSKKGFPLPINRWLDNPNFKEVMYADWQMMRNS